MAWRAHFGGRPVTRPRDCYFWILQINFQSTRCRYCTKVYGRTFGLSLSNLCSLSVTLFPPARHFVVYGLWIWMYLPVYTDRRLEIEQPVLSDQTITMLNNDTEINLSLWKFSQSFYIIIIKYQFCHENCAYKFCLIENLFDKIKHDFKKYII